MQFQNFHRNDLPIATYLRQCKATADELGAAEKPVDTEIFNTTMFNSIRKEFSEVMAALSTKNNTVLFAELNSVFTNHEIRLNLLKPVNDLS